MQAYFREQLHHLVKVKYWINTLLNIKLTKERGLLFKQLGLSYLQTFPSVYFVSEEGDPMRMGSR